MNINDVTRNEFARKEDEKRAVEKIILMLRDDNFSTAQIQNIARSIENNVVHYSFVSSDIKPQK